jgi:hypothetical protein
LTGLDTNENVWISLEGDNGYYGESNTIYNDINFTHTYTNTVEIKVPAGDYKVVVYPSSHSGGLASDSSGADSIEFDTYDWDFANATITSISSGNKDFDMQFVSAATLENIAGTVVCGSSDCSGLIEAFDNTNGASSEVNSTGNFEIKGLTAGDYTLYYYGKNGTQIEESNATAGNLNVTVEAEAGTNWTDINGSIVDSSENNDSEAVLIDFDGTNWTIIESKSLDANNSFSFGSNPKAETGHSLIVAAGVRSIDLFTGASTIQYTSAKVVDDNGAGNVIFVSPFAYTGGNTYTLSASAQ